MSKLLKATAVFLSSVLFSISIITDKYCIALSTKTLGSEQEMLDSNLSHETPDLFLLSRHGEKLVTPIKNFPVFNLQNHCIDVHGNFIYTEPGKLRTGYGYLLSSVTISPNLTSSAIVFPFHYFW